MPKTDLIRNNKQEFFKCFKYEHNTFYKSKKNHFKSKIGINKSTK